MAADTATGNLTVQATVASACTVADATLNFGSVDPAAGTAAPVAGSIDVTCTLGTVFAVGLDDGLNVASGQRRMRLGATSDYLDYEIYQDALEATRFGDTDNSDRVTNVVGLGITANAIPIFGTVAGSQAAPAGDYEDTVQVTVYY